MAYRVVDDPEVGRRKKWYEVGEDNRNKKKDYHEKNAA
jgi:hypothetical protein